MKDNKIGFLTENEKLNNIKNDDFKNVLSDQIKLIDKQIKTANETEFGLQCYIYGPKFSGKSFLVDYIYNKLEKVNNILKIHILDVNTVIGIEYEDINSIDFSKTLIYLDFSKFNNDVESSEHRTRLQIKGLVNKLLKIKNTYVVYELNEFHTRSVRFDPALILCPYTIKTNNLDWNTFISLLRKNLALNNITLTERKENDIKYIFERLDYNKFYLKNFRLIDFFITLFVTIADDTYNYETNIKNRFNSYLIEEEPEKKIKTEEKAIDKLNNLVGANDLKEKVLKLQKFASYINRMKNKGYEIPNITLSFAFLGNAGTGKSTVARILAQVLYENGLLPENKLVEVDRSKLIASYTGQTAPLVNKIFDQAKGGLLFIDEAYSLTRGENSKTSYGSEAIDAIIKRMEDDRGKLAIIFAGYNKEMEQFFNMNSGLKSRIRYYFQFEDFTGEQLYKIFESKAQQYKLVVDEKCKKPLTEIFDYFRIEYPSYFGNGRFAENMFQETLQNHALRELTDQELNILSVEDLPTKEDILKTYFTNIKE